MERANQELLGSCHCNHITYTLSWPDDGPLPLRKCNCTFCIKHSPTYFGSSKASLRLRLQDLHAMTKYEFGSHTASFYFCANCGTFLLAISMIDRHKYAVMNANTLNDHVASSITQMDYEGEDIDARLSRRKATWIRDFRMTLGDDGP